MITFRGPEGAWHRVFAWRPVKIHRRWYWLQDIFRREKNRFMLPHQGYEYGLAFDVIKDPG